jgi:hypothetical protein
MHNPFVAFLRRCWSFLAAPSQAAAEVVCDRAYLGGILLHWAACAANLTWAGETLWPAWRSASFDLVAAVALALPAMLVVAAMIHALARLAGGRGTWLATLALCGYAWLPVGCFVLGVGLAAGLWYRLFGPLPLSLPVLGVLALTVLALVVLALVILRVAVGVNYLIGRGRAWAVALAGCLLLLAGGGLIKGVFVEACHVRPADLLAMSTLGVPIADRQADGGRLRLEISANRTYVRHLPLRRGQVVLFRGRDGQVGVARILGLPGEAVRLRQGRLVVNGASVDEPWRLAGKVTVDGSMLDKSSYFLWVDDRRGDVSLGLPRGDLGVVTEDRVIGPPLAFEQAVFRRLFPRDGDR